MKLLKSKINKLMWGIKKIKFAKIVKKPVAIGIAVGVVLAVVGTVGALNGWFGGGAKIPEDTMTRGLMGYWGFDEQAGPLVMDKSGQGNDGMINDGGSGNPVAYWTFDEGTGQTAYDYTGSNNGTLGSSGSADSADPVWSSSGRVGGALQFDGVDDYVNAGNSTVFDLTTAFTFEAWINRATVGVSQNTFINKGGAFNLMVNENTDTLNLLWIDGAWRYHTSTGVVPKNKWVHVAGVLDGTNVILYIDGKLDSTQAKQGSVPTNTGDLLIGYWTVTQHFTGLIDDVRIYNYARGAAQIQRDYQETYKTKFTGGKVGSAMQFDGVDDNVTLNDGVVSSPLNFTTSNFTVEGWFKFDNINTRQDLVSRGNDSISGWITEIYNDGLVLRTSQAGAQQVNVSSWGSVVADTWYHLVFVRSGTSALFYRNGTLLSMSQVQSIIDPLTTTLPTTIGRLSNVDTGYVNGLIDDVRIYNRALSAAEVSYHYNRGGPVAQWTFDEGNGTTTYDSTGNNNDGTLGNGTCSSGAGTCPTWTTGKYGTGLLFDGTNDYVDAGVIDAIEGISSFTVGAWIKLNVQWSQMSASYPGFIGKNGMWRIYGDQSNNKLKFYLDDSTSVRHDISSDTVMTSGKWYYVVGIYDGSVQKLFIDGVQQANIASWSGTLESEASNLDFGKGDSGFFNGLIDDIRIYNYARSADEIRLDYNAGFGVHFGGSPADDITRGLVGYWNMDEGDGGYVYDQSDYKNTGYIGPTGKALSFDGTDDYVDAGTSLDFDLTTAGTIEARVKFQVTATQYGVYAGKIGSGDFWYYLFTQNDYGGVGHPRLLFSVKDSGGYKQISTNIDAVADTWYHLVGTWDSTNVKFYVNNSLIQSIAGGACLSSSTAPVSIGGTTFSPRWNNGLVDEVRIYNRALTATEITEHYKGIFSNETGLVGYWPFSEGSGSIAYDKSGRGNNGTLGGGVVANMPTWRNNAPKFAAGAPAANGGSQGTALQFDGVDDFVLIADSASLNPAVVTNEMWIKPNNVTGFTILTYKSSTVTPWESYRLYINNGNAGFRIALTPGGSVSGDAVNATTLQVGQWYHIVGAFDGSQIIVYVNGVAGIPFVLSGSIWQTDSALRIGGIPQYPFSGSIDEVRIYNRALTAEEIRYHYNRGGPVAQWKFDEGNGTTTYDSTNNGNDGYFQTAASSPTWTTGKYGTALSFDGTNDYINAGNGTSLQITSSITLEAWVKYTRAGEVYQRIISKLTDSPYSGYELLIFRPGEGNKPYLQLFNNGAAKLVVSSDPLPENEWHHLAGIYDASTGMGKIYIDGVVKGTASGWGSSAIGSSAVNVNIGRWSGTASNYFNGLIDDARIYNYARTPDEIRLDYNEGLSVRFGPTPMSPAGCDLDPAGCMSKGLVGYWNMNEGSGDFVYDQSDYKNTGYARPYGKALSFDGSDDYVNCGNNSSLDITNAIALEAWIKPTVIPFSTNGSIINRDTNVWEIEGNTGANSLEFTSTIGGVNLWFSTIGTSFASGQWAHVVLTYDGTNLIWYVNGVVNNSTAIYSGAIVTNTGNLEIGKRKFNNTYFNGSIDDVRIYNRALSATEVAEHYKGTFSNETGLVGYWPFSEGSGSITYDKSGKGNNGTLGAGVAANMPTWRNNAPKYTAGAPAVGGGTQGTALQFDGVDDYVEAGGAAGTLDITQQITLEAWFKTNKVTGDQKIISKAQGGGASIVNKGYHIGIQNNAILFALGRGGAWATTPWTNQLSIGTLNAGVWYHVVGTYDGNDQKIYINGQYDSKMSRSGALVSITSEPLIIGVAHWNDSWTSQYLMDGLIDEVRIYNRALSAEEIRYHYNKGGPMAHWTFDEGQGQTAFDSTNNNNDGTLGSTTAADAGDPTWTTGKYGSALSFDGTNDYVNAGSGASLDITGAITIEAWIKPYTAASWKTIVAKRAGSNLQWQFGIVNDVFPSILGITWYDGAWPNQQTAAIVQQDQWQHVVFTWDGTTPAFYLNAVAYSSTGNPINFQHYPASPVYIGQDGVNTSWRFWDGLIDDVRVYNYARTQDQIKQDYNQGLSTYFK